MSCMQTDTSSPTTTHSASIQTKHEVTTFLLLQHYHSSPELSNHYPFRLHDHLENSTVNHTQGSTHLHLLFFAQIPHPHNNHHHPVHRPLLVVHSMEPHSNHDWCQTVAAASHAPICGAGYWIKACLMTDCVRRTRYVCVYIYLCVCAFLSNLCYNTVPYALGDIVNTDYWRAVEEKA